MSETANHAQARDLATIAPNYLRAVENWRDATTLRRHYEALEIAYARGGFGVVDHVKSFIECVCLTIVTDFGAKAPENPSIGVLLRCALQALGIQNSRGASKFDSVLSGFNKIADAIGEMRNAHGPVSHGKDGFTEVLAADQARIFLHAGDAILSVLMNAREGKSPDLRSTRERYESFERLSAQIDQSVAIVADVDNDADTPIFVLSVGLLGGAEAIQIRLEPSRLLFGVDREAYVDLLRSSSMVREEPRAGDDDREQVALRFPSTILSPNEAPQVILCSEYRGRLEELIPALSKFLISEGLDPGLTVGDDARLADSLMATMDANIHIDQWKSDALKARLKIACRRLLVQFNLDGQAKHYSERLLWWIQIQGHRFGVEPA